MVCHWRLAEWCAPLVRGSNSAPQVHQILNKYLSQFDLHPSFSEDEVEHWLLPRKGVIYSFVAETKGKVPRAERRSLSLFAKGEVWTEPAAPSAACW